MCMCMTSVYIDEGISKTGRSVCIFFWIIISKCTLLPLAHADIQNFKLSLRISDPGQVRWRAALAVQLVLASSLGTTHGLQRSRLSCPSSPPRVCSDSCPLSRWSHPSISSSVVPFFSCLQSFPASESSPMSWLFASDGQSIEASTSASALPINIHGWFLRIPGLIFLEVQVPLENLLQHHSSKASIRTEDTTQPSSCPTLTCVFDYWKTHGFNYTDLCQQSDVSTF